MNITFEEERRDLQHLLILQKSRIVSGKGGDGKVGFHREKYVAATRRWTAATAAAAAQSSSKVDDNLSAAHSVTEKVCLLWLPI